MGKQTIWVDAQMAKKLKVVAARTGTTMLELANAALTEYLEKVEAHALETTQVPLCSQRPVTDERW